MKNIILFFVCAIFLCSCSNKKQNWLKEYQQAKCSWANTEEAFLLDTLQATLNLYQQKGAITSQLEMLKSPFQNKIVALQKSSKAIEQKYFNEYHRITDAHSLTHGHVSTPEYERRVAVNEKNKNNEIEALQIKIDALKMEIENIPQYKELNEKLKLVVAEIQNAKNNSKQKFKPTFDSLQNVIDNSNYDFKIISTELKEPDRQNFINERDSIRTNPCKPINANL